MEITKEEKRILEYLNTVKSGDSKLITEFCKIENERRSIQILLELKGNGFVKGNYIDILVVISEKGRKLLLELNKPWYKKMDWKWIITTIIAISAVVASILNFILN